MTTKIINIAADFSEYPAGRYLSDGPYSGEKFRKDFLVPALRGNEQIVVEIDGVEGYGSSFLEECFGGLIREEGFSREELQKKLRIKFEDHDFEIYQQEIMDYIMQAE